MAASSIGLIFVIALHYRLKQIRDQKIIPRLRLSRGGHHTPKLERFSHYVGKKICIFFSITCMDPLIFYHLEIDFFILFIAINIMNGNVV
jgi:hypothetical protein